MGGSINRKRVLFIEALFIFLFLSALGRLFYLQIFKGSDYQEAARQQQRIADVVLPERGSIYLKNSENIIPVALTSTWYNVWVAPKDIPLEQREEVANKLAELLKVDKEIILERINKENDPYEPIKDKVEKDSILEIKALGFKGVHWKAFQDRYYPLNDLASRTIGFVTKTVSNDGSRSGQYGLEGYFDKELKGELGYVAGVKKALGSLVLSLSQVTKAINGNDVYLTIDYNIQRTLEKELKIALEKFSAEGASGIVMDPKTGAILAMTALPNFDPNKYNEVKNVSQFLNSNIQLVFEPGSIFKPITMASALDINVVSPELKYYDSGEVNVDGFTIRNSTLQSWGEQNMAQVLEKSLNTGVIFVLRRIPQGVWREYINNFGFSEKTGITLSGEARGDIRNLKSGVEIDWLTSSFGQGISVTPIAMTTAIAAIANGGELLKPYIVEKIIDNSTGENKLVLENKKEVRHRVIKQSTSETLTKMLVGVVENGSGKYARIPGYSVAGKTGTAQVSASNAAGYGDKTIHTFIGYSPAYNPAFVMLIRLDNPQGARFSESTAAPVFKNVGEYILHYLNVIPDENLVK
ncbi:MAG: penicillin-binding protein 2 [Patescibacteria group bacterium]